MIRVTRINDTELIINSDLIEFVESVPDTMISLTTGKRILVKETIEEVVKRVAEFKQLASARPIEAGRSALSDGR